MPHYEFRTNGGAERHTTRLLLTDRRAAYREAARLAREVATHDKAAPSVLIEVTEDLSGLVFMYVAEDDRCSGLKQAIRRLEDLPRHLARD